MSPLHSRAIAGMIPLLATTLLLAITAPARADLVTGSFTGTIGDNENDPDNLTQVAISLSTGNTISGTFSFNTSAISTGIGTDTLVISVSDTTTSQSATYYDTGTGGYYGNGSYFDPTAGSYYLDAASGAGDALSQLAELDFISPGIQEGAYGQTFTIGAGSGSYGRVEGDFDGFDDGYINFSIDSATMTGATLPEPGGLGIFGFALLGLVRLRRRRL